MNASVPATPQRIGGRALDWTMALLALFFVGGLYLDGWAHTHGRVDESFFTPWHAVLYSGFALNFLALAGVAWVNRSRGASWAEALPAGYWLALGGLGLWFLGGPGDLLWHTLFGIEESIDALYSPTHLLLAAGLVLGASGAYRAAWARRESPRSLGEQLPMLLSLAATLAGLTFFLEYTHPVGNFWGLGRFPQGQDTQAFGIVALLLINSVLLGALLLTLRRWRLAPGAVAVVFGVNAVAIGFMAREYPYGQVGAFLAAALLIEAAYRWLGPSPRRVAALRLFAFLAPALVTSAHFAVGLLGAGLSWSVHLTWGAVVLSGAAGLLLSLLAVPPALPEGAEA